MDFFGVEQFQAREGEGRFFSFRFFPSAEFRKQSVVPNAKSYSPSYHPGSLSPPAAPLSTAASVAAIQGSGEEEPLAEEEEEEGADAAAVGAADAAAAALIGDATPLRLRRRGCDDGTTDRERFPVR